MFERLMLHGAAMARARARRRRSEVAAALRDEAPQSIRVAEAGEESVAIEGRGLERRFALEPELRWLFAGRRR